MPEPQCSSLPHSEDLEKGLLSSMLLDCSIAPRIEHPEVFYLEPHKIIFTAIQAAVAEGSPVDYPTLLHRLSPVLQEIGGKQYLSELYGFIPTPKAWEHYYGSLLELHDKRH